MTESLVAAPGHPPNLEPRTGQPAARAAADARFFARIAGALLAAVLVGFAPSFYLRPWFDVAPEAPRVWLHGTVLTAWFALFWLQAEWVARRRIAWHRRAGWLGAALAFAAVVTAVHVTLAAAAAGTTNPRPVWSNLANATAFAAFVGTAIALRRNSDTHKRLMLLASIAFVQPAMAAVFVVAPSAFGQSVMTWFR